MALKSIMIAKKLQLKRAAFEQNLQHAPLKSKKQSAKLPPMRSSRLLRTP